jgi:tRNA pseudouridine38-40 synthase
MANREDLGRKLALLVEYEGTAFGGSQFQNNAPTVQGTLERALGSLTGEPTRVAMAGRTDAGVHASGQVASFVTRSRHSAATVVRAANALLPEAVSIRAAYEVPLDFDPRGQATSRWYRYTLDTSPQRPALMRRSVWYITVELEMDAMAEASRSLEGSHDFAAFTAPSESKRSVTIRNVKSAGWRCGGRLATFEIEANAFLPHMVRRIVGTLVEVGRGRLTPGEFERMVNEAPPGAASRTAPPRGLCLMKVCYESGLFDDKTDEDI